MRQSPSWPVSLLAALFAAFVWVGVSILIKITTRRKETWWNVLGVPRNASPATIKAAYRALAKVLHPDLPTGSQQAFLRLRWAYEESSKVQEPDQKYDEDYWARRFAEGYEPTKPLSPKAVATLRWAMWRSRKLSELATFMVRAGMVLATASNGIREAQRVASAD